MDSGDIERERGITTVRVELDNDYPVKLVFALADGNARVNYLLAPRIESE